MQDIDNKYEIEKNRDNFYIDEMRKMTTIVGIMKFIYPT